ncbi:MAG: hypothetical protein IKZ47_01615 [Clostridia bacterium]|nr:hypothetical protein [Clostridia bacterium]MBR4910005.1 hypothetical protein [Clostridia bacterium]
MDDGILIFCGRIESAVGKIAYSTSKLLIEDGKNCYFLGLNSTFGYRRSPFDYSVNSKVYLLKYFLKKSETSFKIKRLFFLFLYKTFDAIFNDHIHGVENNKKIIKKRLNRLIKRFKIKRIISFYMPNEILAISYDICQKKSIEFLPFLLDNAKHEHETDYDLYFSISPRILCLPWVLNDDWFVKKYHKKIVELDLPIIPWSNKPVLKKSTSAGISFILFGALYKDIRNPALLFDSLMKLNKDFIIKTFCSGCNDILSEYKSLMPKKVIVNDRVTIDVLHDEIALSDFVIIIGNTVSNQMPSKIYEIIGSGKPIMYFYQNCDDLGLNLVKRYPLAIVVNYSDLSNENELNRIINWCESNKGKRLSYNDYINNYPECSIDRFVKEICNTL